MTETLTIRNFGPIKDVKLDIRKVTVLIGEQATGKSTIAKLLAVCRYFSYITNFDYFEKGGNAFYWGLISWGLREFIQKETFISYSCRHYNFSAKAKAVRDNPGTDIPDVQQGYDMETMLEPKSDEFKKLLEELRSISKDEDSFSLSSTPVTFFQNKVAAVMDNPFYLPAERGLQSLFSLTRSSIQNLSDSLFNQLAKMDSHARRFKDDTEIRPLHIYYRNVDGKGYVKKYGTDDYFSLANGATGYQSAIPIMLATKHYSIVRRKEKTFLIEEPELGLFPTAQKKLVDALIESVNIFSHSLFLTTHSPYVLGALNNLVYAHVVGEVKARETEPVVESKYWLSPETVSAHLLQQDGTCLDIMDRKENLIAVDKIDEVSALINRTFNELIEIEMGVNEKH